MKPWSLKELERNNSKWEALVGAQLQKVIFHPKSILFLEFYKTEPILLFIDLRRPNCFLGFLHGTKAPKKQKKDVPISLFLRSRFESKRLQSVDLCSQFGRVLRFHFSSDHFFELRLYPKDVNVIAESEDKRISWAKPRELEELEDSYEPVEYRDMIEASSSWWDEFHSTGKKTDQQDKEKTISQYLKKNRKQLKSAKLDLEKMLPDDWRILAEALLAGLCDELTEGPKALLARLEPDKVSTQAGLCFERAKKEEKKALGLSKRIADLEREIDLLERGEWQAPVLSKQVNSNDDLQKKTGAKTRSKNIASDLRVHIGRSAKENILLLRKAKPWFLWMHLKDLPGNHLIVEKNKNRLLSQKELVLAAQELASMKKQVLDGESFLVQYSECRYVNPIKGDKLGRVQVKKEQVLQVRSKKA